MIESTAVDDQILDDRERLCPPRLDHNGIALFEMAHVQLASCDRLLWAVRHTVDHQAAHATDPLTTVVIEGHRFLVVMYQRFVEQIHHFEERRLRADLIEHVIYQFSWCAGVLLTPDS
ncbi:MAG: hypothetical protein R2856_04925 [Caldilineaceae bacterium]